MKVVEKPLLKLPNAEGWNWARMTAEDLRRINQQLEKDRRRTNGWTVARLLSTMNEIGVKTHPTEEDEKLVREFIQKQRKEGNGFEMAQVYSWMKDSGRSMEIPHADREFMVKHFRVWWKDNTGYENFFRYFLLLKKLGLRTELDDIDKDNAAGILNVARRDGKAEEILKMHFFLREMEIPQTITQDDEKAVYEFIDGNRRHKDGPDVMSIYFSRAINAGFKIQPTEGDMQLMKRSMEHARRIDDAFTVALELATMKKIMEALIKPGSKEQDMPPLKRLT